MIRTGVEFQIRDNDWQRVYDAAEKAERQNVRSFCGRDALIEGGDYIGLWLETQPMGGEMYAKRNPVAGMNNQRIFMENIREDGRLPSVLFLRDGKLDMMFSHLQGYCFPYHALNMYYWTGRGDRAYLTQLYEVLRRFDEYLWRTRDSDGNGCLESFCVYDTGEDNSTRFYDAPVMWEKDTPPIGVARLPYESMDMMGYSIDGCEALAAISALLQNGEEAHWKQKAQSSRDTLRKFLWREERGACYDRDGNNQFLDTLIHNNLRVMYHGGFDTYMADRFIREHLLDPAEFWTPMPLPSLAANDPLFRSVGYNNWSGQPQGLTYQRAVRALNNYGYHALVPVLGDKLFGALASSEPCVFTQQFDPFTAKPSEADGMTNYGPTILAFLEYTAQMFGVNPSCGRIGWGTEGSHGAYIYTQHWGDREYTVENDGKTASLRINGREIDAVPTGTWVVTDENGDHRQRETLMREFPFRR